MNGLDIKRWNYYKEEQGMEPLLIFFIKNVIIKAPLFAYIKMINAFFEVMHQYLGLILAIVNLLQIVFYLRYQIYME